MFIFFTGANFQSVQLPSTLCKSAPEKVGVYPGYSACMRYITAFWFDFINR
jgi:hypothetical protein